MAIKRKNAAKDLESLKEYHQERKGPEQREKQREADERRKGSEKRKRTYIAASHKRRALVAGNGGTHTREEVAWLVDQFDGMCAYCSAPYEELDHDVPISRGGSNSIGNILPACSPCNRRKHAKTALEFIWSRFAI